MKQAIAFVLVALAAGCGGEVEGDDGDLARVGETTEAVRSTQVVTGYHFPWTAGAVRRVTQYPHAYRDQIWNAIDFGLPRGSEVVAMRDGVVSAVIDGFADLGFGQTCLVSSCNNTTNFIIVQHADGNESSYLHIAQHSARVKVGDHVCAGTVLGLVGLNGYTSGPHLHVSVQAGGSSGDRNQAWTAMWSKNTKPIAFLEIGRGVAQGVSYTSQTGSGCDGAPDPVPTPVSWSCSSSAYRGQQVWTCSRGNLYRCQNGVPEETACASGCVVRPLGTDDVCR